MTTPDGTAPDAEATRAALSRAHGDARLPDDATAQILATAREVARERRAASAPPRPVAVRAAWHLPLGLAASFAGGLLVSWWVLSARGPLDAASRPPLTMQESDAQRGAATAAVAIPVERADPQRWYRYIQELVAAGDLREAERHLKRFNELHPGFVPTPE
jgi:hypothetical protein